MKIAIIGTVGVPGRYGGFETLAENLVHYHARNEKSASLTVWCSSIDTTERLAKFSSSDLRYVGLRANGIQSIPYDAICLWQAIRSGHNRIILLGVSGALVLPLVRLFSRARVLTNIDGIEWKRKKWNGLARAILKASEWAAVKFSHGIIADNEAIAEHVHNTYRTSCHVIAYGGDHAVARFNEPTNQNRHLLGLPLSYALALCRIEPENNIHTILDGWTRVDTPLVVVGNWSNSNYGRDLKDRFKDHPNLHLLDPIYDPSHLQALRKRAWLYVHGHSAGGTNPSLVEMMHFAIPILAYDCSFNRYSTENKAHYFETPSDLVREVRGLTPQISVRIGRCMQEIAQRRYTWDYIGDAYFTLLEDN